MEFLKDVKAQKVINYEELKIAYEEYYIAEA